MKTVRALFNENPTAMFLAVEKKMVCAEDGIPLGIHTVYRSDSEDIFITIDGRAQRLQDSVAYVLYEPASVLAEAAVLDEAETREILALQRGHKVSFAMRSIAYLLGVSIFVTMMSYVITEVANGGEVADVPSNITGTP